jgi:hypothetical protein
LEKLLPRLLSLKIELDGKSVSWTLERIHALNWHLSIIVKGFDESGQGIWVFHVHLILRRLRFFNNVALDGDLMISFQRVSASMIILEVISTLTLLRIHLHLVGLVQEVFIMRVETCELLNRLRSHSFIEMMMSVKHLVSCHPA